MSARIWDGAVKDGRLMLCDREGFRQLVDSLEGKAIQITLDKLRANRSNQQNRYYWGVVIDILARECGYEREEMHEALKARFLRAREEEEVGGLPRIRSTASLDTREFADYVDNCIRLAAEMGIVIPEACENLSV